jgi:hypothetical protein
MLINSGYAQTFIKAKDVKVKNDTAYYLGVPQFIIKDRMLNEIFINDINTGQPTITMAIRKAPSLEGPTKANPDGMDSYYEFTWVTKQFKCDYRPNGIGLKAISKELLSYGIFENGVLNESAMNSFISLKGTPYTDRNNRTIIVVD